MRFSLRRRLLWLLLGGLLGLFTGAGILTYMQARSEVNSLLDYELQQMASMFGAHMLAHPDLSLEPLLRVEYDHVKHDHVIQVWDQGNRLLLSSRPGYGPSQPLPSGFSQEGTNNHGWRSFTTKVGEYTLQIAEPLESRRQRAFEIAFKAMFPVAATVPLGGAIIWLLVVYALKPLRRITKEVETRDPRSLNPIPATRLPTEIAPLVNALNDLLNRLSHALEAQKQFIADASHELRTPVHALGLQVELIESARCPAERDDLIQDVKRSVQRLERLIAQILTMARLDPEPEFNEMPENIDLYAFISELMAEFSSIATAKAISFGMRSSGRPRVTGEPVSLRALIGNVVDNALRYTPEGGTVTIELEDRNGFPVIRVVDSGPGIPDDVRSRLFARFSRGDRAEHGHGVGLGLAIAKRAAERLGAQLRLQDGSGGKGLAAIIEFTEQRA